MYLRLLFGQYVEDWKAKSLTPPFSTDWSLQTRQAGTGRGFGDLGLRGVVSAAGAVPHQLAAIGGRIGRAGVWWCQPRALGILLGLDFD